MFYVHIFNQTIQEIKWLKKKKYLVACNECTQANSGQRVHSNNALHVGNMHMFPTWIKCLRPKSAGGHVWWNSAEPQVSLHPFILLWNSHAQRETTGQAGGWQWWDVAQNCADVLTWHAERLNLKTQTITSGCKQTHGLVWRWLCDLPKQLIYLLSVSQEVLQWGQKWLR